MSDQINNQPPAPSILAPEEKKIMITIPVSRRTHRRLKTVAAITGRTMRSLIERAVEVSVRLLEEEENDRERSE